MAIVKNSYRGEGFVGMSFRMNRLILCGLLGSMVTAEWCWGFADQARSGPDADSLTSYNYAAKTPIQDVRPQVIQRAMMLNGGPSGGGGGSLGPIIEGVISDVGSCDPIGSGTGMRFGIGVIDDFPGGSGTVSGGGGGVQLPSGNPALRGTVLHLPQPGDMDVVFGLDYNNRQTLSGSPSVSSGYAGKNMFQTFQSELVFYDDATNSKDMMYLVTGASSYVEFKRKSGVSPDFIAVNGASGSLTFAAGATSEPDTYTYTNLKGEQMVFFGFDADAGAAAGQLWKLIDPAGNTAFVGDATTGSTAIANGYSSGKVLKVYDASDRRYTAAYSGAGLMTEVKAETKASGTWASPSGVVEVGKVTFTYYDDGDGNSNDDNDGDTRDLKLITLTVPLSDSGATITSKTYIRYYTGTYDATTNPGNPHDIKMVLKGEAIRQTGLSDGSLETASESSLKPYASVYYKYNTSDQVVESLVNGKCGCSGGATGKYIYRYDTSGYTNNPGYDTAWATRVVIKTPGTYSGGSKFQWLSRTFDEDGQETSLVVADDDPAITSPAQPKWWATVYTRNSDGLVTEIATPKNITAYTHSNGTFTQDASVGLIQVFDRISSGDTKGLVQHVKYKEGTSGTAYLSKSVFYDAPTKAYGDATLVHPVVKSQTIYTTQTSTADTGPGYSPPSGAYRTEMANTFYANPNELSLEKIVTTAPEVTTGKNGPGGGTGVQSSRHFKLDGVNDFSKAPDGEITYRVYTNGQMAKVVRDADTTKTSSGQDFFGVSIPSGFSSSGSPFHSKTETTYDSAGRSSQVKQFQTKGSSGTVQKADTTYYTKLADGRKMTLNYAKVVAGSPTQYYGPVQCTVTNLAGKVELRGVIKLDDNSGEYTTKSQTDHVDETQSDPLLAINWHASNRIGTIARMSTSLYDEVGSQLKESRQYFLIPASGAGSAGTNYDATTYGYDDSGHQWRVESPDGTVQRTVYDAIGRVKEQWIGTNDNDAAFPGGDNAGTNNMVKTEALEYDSGNDKSNGLLTSRTAFIQDNSTGQRVTSYLYDMRGRMIVQINPTAPHALNKYDDAGRLIATAQYSSSSGLDAGDDPTSLDTNRLALLQRFYDEMGRVWKTQRHKIDQADGSDDDDLQELTWYDADGRVIMVQGNQLTKTAYDRLGRAIHSYVLATTDDASYSDADDVSGDIVLQQNDTTYDDNSGLVLMTATIERFHDDGSGGTSGELDTNADGLPLKYTATDVLGRIQITSNWYDSIDRLVDTVQYGTYGGSDFNRSGLSVPSRSDTALRTTTVYNPDGSTKSVTDPRNIETQYVYDDAGRQTAIINNYVNGTPSGGTGDDDVYTRFTYSAGHKTEMWVDFDGDGVQDSGDQVTTYSYGVSKGASAGDSKISSGSLLHQVVYPAQSGGQSSTDRQNLYAYNAQGQQIWMTDQEANVTEYNYDDSGRQTHKRLTTLGGSFDGTVKRISTTYDGLGRRSLVTQYNNATVGSGSVTDEVKFTYDDWGNLSNFEQDNNSTVGAGGSVDDYEVKYTYAKATTGRNALQRSTMKYTYASTDLVTLGFNYRSDHGRLDEAASRVSNVEIDPAGTPVQIAIYEYNGIGSVVGLDLGEASVYNHRYAGGGSYPDLDRFNRVTSDTWYKYLASPLAFFDNDITYDRDSNITLVEDNIFTPSISSGFDAQYTMDNLNRLTQDQQGNWNGSSFTSTSRQQIWTLTQTGNWDKNRVDRNGDSDFIDASPPEVDVSGTFNAANELTDQDLDTDNDAAYDDTHYDLAYNKLGEMTDDGQNYTYVFDGFGRLKQILTRGGSPALVEEYWYNGLGNRISWKYDTDADNDVDGSDKKYHFAYDERWRVVATYRESDTTPKERFFYHCAGADGQGGSSYIDAAILRDKDANTNWVTTASDGTLERRDYYCQNWRSDVVALITSGGRMVEWVKYSAYGIPYGIPCGDTNGDGTVNINDTVNAITWVANPAVKPTADYDLDGDIDSNDVNNVSTTQSGVTEGWGVLSKAGGSGASANRKGYAGYEFDAITASSLWHVRHRVLNSELGRWTSRDPLNYSDGLNFCSYIRSNPINGADHLGMCTNGGCTGPCKEITNWGWYTPPYVTGTDGESSIWCSGITLHYGGTITEGAPGLINQLDMSIMNKCLRNAEINNSARSCWSGCNCLYQSYSDSLVDCGSIVNLSWIINHPIFGSPMECQQRVYFNAKIHVELGTGMCVGTPDPNPGVIIL